MNGKAYKAPVRFAQDVWSYGVKVGFVKGVRRRFWQRAEYYVCYDILGSYLGSVRTLDEAANVVVSGKMAHPF